jgi:hypothetical protein
MLRISAALTPNRNLVRLFAQLRGDSRRGIPTEGLGLGVDNSFLPNQGWLLNEPGQTTAAPVPIQVIGPGDRR